MKLNLLAQIKKKFSTNRRRTRLKLKNSNSARGRVMAALNRDTSSNSAQNRLVVTNVNCRYLAPETPEQILNRLFSESGWVVRRHFTDKRFRIENLENHTVAFSLRDDNDDLQKYSGVLQPFCKVGSALFRLAGEETVFNANLVGFMATRA
jgi:hypothetical protein